MPQRPAAARRARREEEQEPEAREDDRSRSPRGLERPAHSARGNRHAEEEHGKDRVEHDCRAQSLGQQMGRRPCGFGRYGEEGSDEEERRIRYRQGTPRQQREEREERAEEHRRRCRGGLDTCENREDEQEDRRGVDRAGGKSFERPPETLGNERRHRVQHDAERGDGGDRYPCASWRRTARTR